MKLKGKPLSLFLTRHTNKDINQNPTKYGLRKSREEGKGLNSSTIFKGYTSQSKRAASALNEMEKGFKSINGRVISSKNPLRNELAEKTIFKDMEKVMDYWRNETNSNDLLFQQKWLNNEVPTKIAKSPKEVADEVISKRIGQAIRFLRLKQRNNEIAKLPEIHLRSITHGFITHAVFQRLTGMKYFEKYKKDTGIREGLVFDFYPTKEKVKIMMTYRGESFDVTNQVYKIIK